MNALPRDRVRVANIGRASDAPASQFRPTSTRVRGSRELCSGYHLDRYELLVRLGAGGMGEVWAAQLRGTRGFRKLVAVKVLLPHLCGDPEFERLFLEEARIAAQLQHPNVASVIDLGEQDGFLFLVMEWLEGVSLSDLLRVARDSGGIPIPVAVRIIMQACAGLHAAHESRDEHDIPLELVHCDISPQNLMVTFDGATKVLDFGVAKLADATDKADSTGLVGKRSYVAPEQALGQRFDRRADVYSLGVVLYNLTTGAHPFRRPTAVPPNGEPPRRESALPPRRQWAAYPPDLEAVVLRALREHPSCRYQTANELLLALDALPHSLRAGTDEEVATFVRNLLETQRSRIRSAIGAAAARSEESRSEPPRSSPRLPLLRAESGHTIWANASANNSEEEITVSEPQGLDATTPGAPPDMPCEQEPVALAGDPPKARPTAKVWVPQRVPRITLILALALGFGFARLLPRSKTLPSNESPVVRGATPSDSGQAGTHPTKIAGGFPSPAPREPRQPPPRAIEPAKEGQATPLPRHQATPEVAPSASVTEEGHPSLKSSAGPASAREVPPSSSSSSGRSDWRNNPGF